VHTNSSREKACSERKDSKKGPEKLWTLKGGGTRGFSLVSFRCEQVQRVIREQPPKNESSIEQLNIGKWIKTLELRKKKKGRHIGTGSSRKLALSRLWKVSVGKETLEKNRAKRGRGEEPEYGRRQDRPMGREAQNATTV